jgi:ABC-type multidrug transport system fused ATPase/permease subunit
MMPGSITSKQLSSSKTTKSFRLSPFAVLLTLAALAARLFYLISKYAVNIFFSDQWDFDNATLFEKHSLWQMYSWQHGPHRQGVGALFQALIEPLIHWNSRSEAFIVGAVIVLGTVGALYLKTRLHGPITWSDAIVPLIFLGSVPYTSLLITANFAHGPFPLLLLISYGLAWTCPGIKLRYVLVIFVNFLAIFTGFGIFLGFLTPALIAADYWANVRSEPGGTVHSVLALLASLASLASFFIGYKLQPAADCFSFHLQSPLRYLRFVALMFANLMGAKGIGFFASLIGTIVLTSMILGVVFAGRRLFVSNTTTWTQHLVAATLIAYSLLFCLNTAFGRLCIGLDAAQSPRYTEYMQLGFLGLYLCVLTISRHWLRTVLLLVMGVSLLQSVPTRAIDLNTMKHFSDVKRSWKNCYLATGQISQCDRVTGFWVYPRPEATHLHEKLDFLKQRKQNLYDDIK